MSLKQNFRIFKLFFLLLIVIQVLNSCENNDSKNGSYEPTFAEDSDKEKTITFGIANFSTYIDAEPIVQELNKHLNGTRIKLLACKSMSEYDSLVRKKAFDFLVINGPLIFVAEENGYNIFAKIKEQKEYKSVIFVRKDSAIKKITDLKGKTIAVSEPFSLGGNIMPLFFLHNNGINIKTDLKQMVFPSLRSAIMNVSAGKCAAGVASNDVFEEICKEDSTVSDKLAVMWETPSFINSAILARKEIDQQTINKMLHLLLSINNKNIDGNNILVPNSNRVFEPADSSTYKPLKAFLEEYDRLMKRAYKE